MLNSPHSHPNSVKIIASTKNQKRFEFIADSTGGGSFLLRKFNGWNVNLTGDTHDLLIEIKEGEGLCIEDLESNPLIQESSGSKLLHYKLKYPPQNEDLRKLENVFYAAPVYYTIKGEQIFESAAGIIAYANLKNCNSLADAAIDYESCLLGLSKEEALR